MKSRPTILVVDDDAHHAALVRGILTSTLPNTVVNVAASVREMTSYVRSEWPYDDRSRYPPPALIVLSLGLPDLKGHTIPNLLVRESLPYVSIIAFGPPAEVESAVIAAPDSLCRFLPTPLDFRELLSLTQDLIALSGDADLASPESA